MPEERGVIVLFCYFGSIHVIASFKGESACLEQNIEDTRECLQLLVPVGKWLTTRTSTSNIVFLGSSYISSGVTLMANMCPVLINLLQACMLIVE